MSINIAISIAIDDIEKVKELIKNEERVPECSFLYACRGKNQDMIELLMSNSKVNLTHNNNEALLAAILRMYSHGDHIVKLLLTNKNIFESCNSTFFENLCNENKKYYEPFLKLFNNQKLSLNISSF